MTTIHYHRRVRQSQLEASALASQSRSEHPRAWPAAAMRVAARSPSGASNLINRNHQPSSTLINRNHQQQPSTAHIILHQPALVLSVHSIARPPSLCAESCYVWQVTMHICRGVRDVRRSRDARSACGVFAFAVCVSSFLVHTCSFHVTFLTHKKIECRKKK